MYIIVAVLIGMALGFIRRGSIRAILEHPYKNWIFAAVGLILEGLIHLYCYMPASLGLSSYIPIVSFLAYILIFITLIYNLDDVYTILISIGVTLNFVVTFINGGLMPVSTGIIDIMPLHAALTQSIYAGTSGVYMILVPTQTLLSFLATTIPVPFFVDITAVTGFVSGLSLGSIIYLLGLIGLTQRAMTLPFETVSEPETVIRTKERYPIPEEVEEPTKQFESKTDELFFEEGKIPKNPLDKMFREEEPERYPTQVLKEINVSSDVSEKEREPDPALEELGELTKPISQTLTIEIEEEPPEVIPEEPPVEEEGFFVSQFNAEKQKQSEQAQEPETEEKSYSRDDLLSALDSSPILEETLTSEIEVQKNLFEREASENEPGIFDEESEEDQKRLEELAETLKEPVSEEAVDETVEEIPETAEESEEMPETVSETEKTPTSVEVTEAPEAETEASEVEAAEEVEPVEEKVVEKAEPVEEGTEAETAEAVGIVEEIEPVEEISEKAEPVEEVAEVETAEAAEIVEEAEPIEEVTEAEVSEEVPAKIPEETETEVSEEAPVEETESAEETAVAETGQEENLEAVPLVQVVEETGPPILLGGPSEVESSEEQTLIRIESGQFDRAFLEELLTNTDLENLDEILDSEIDMSSIIVENTGEDQKSDIDRVMQELGQKRGSVQEDERTGYMLTKAQIEMSNRDKSEEQMLDIWSQVAEENRERKLGRRRQATANYQTSNPYSEERERSRQRELDRIREEQEELRWKERERQVENTRHQDETAKTVNAQSDVDTSVMSDEERIAAGYEKVNFEFSGKTISFWRKKNE